MTKQKWWHDKVAYQIYPRSFYDANGDGEGDLKGIIQKLDYIKELGMDIVWISPIYKSPMADNGYDIADYYGIDPRFGTMEDMDELLKEAKKRDMHIVMDLVINHCSDEHEWFQKAIKDPEGPYGQYFYFRQGKNGNPPNNWRSYFGGSAWDLVPGTDHLYYLHMFAKKQPDLNWENVAVLKELYDMVNWWLEKGIAGFRIDAIINIKKDLTFKDYPVDGPDGMSSPHQMLAAVSGVGEMLQDLKKNTFDKYNAFTVGEVFDMKVEELGAFIGEDGHFSSQFDFSSVEAGNSEKGWYADEKITFEAFRKAIFKSQMDAQGIGFLSNIIENHDEPRGASTYLPEEDYSYYSVTTLATEYMLLRGLPFVYQGQEIGMTNCAFKDIEEYDDIGTKDQYQVALNAGLSKEEAMAKVYHKSRDNARTVMQWNDSQNAGFTTGTPWIKVNPNYKEINVSAQEKEECSVLAYYKKLIALRKSPEYKEVFTYGNISPLFEKEDKIFAYERSLETKSIIVLCNFSMENKVVLMNQEVEKVLLNNYDDLKIEETTITLKEYQSVVLLMKEV